MVVLAMLRHHNAISVLYSDYAQLMFCSDISS